MFGVIIVAVSSVFREIGIAIGKNEFNHDREDVFSMGFINALIGTTIFLTIAFFTKEFTIAPESYPTLFLRLVLGVIMLFVTLQAVTKASRSVFTFLRVLTLPLLLLVDLVIGYILSLTDIAGIIIITIGVLCLHIGNVLSPQGKGWVIASALLAVATTSLFKYNVTFYNSVAAEQSIMLASQMVAVLIAAFFVKKTNPFKALASRRHIIQACTFGAGSSMISYAFLFAPTSVIMSAKRSFSILIAIFSGHYYFHEKHFVGKIIGGIVISLGVILLVV